MHIPEKFWYDIIQVLDQAKLRRATGMDGVSAEILTLEKEIVSNYLFQLWKSIGITGYMPSPLLQGFVVPILKTGTRHYLSAIGRSRYSRTYGKCSQLRSTSECRENTRRMKFNSGLRIIAVPNCRHYMRTT